MTALPRRHDKPTERQYSVSVDGVVSRSLLRHRILVRWIDPCACDRNATGSGRIRGSVKRGPRCKPTCPSTDDGSPLRQATWHPYARTQGRACASEPSLRSRSGTIGTYLALIRDTAHGWVGCSPIDCSRSGDRTWAPT